MELFRLAAVRPPDLATGRVPAIELVAIEEPEAGPRPEVVDAVTGHVLDIVSWDANGGRYTVPLSDVDALLGLNEDAVAPRRIVHLVENRTDRRLREVVAEPFWTNRKDWLAWLIQTAMAREGAVEAGRFREANGWLRALRIMSLLDALAALNPDNEADQRNLDVRLGGRRRERPEAPQAPTEELVRQFMRYSIIRLPRRIPPAPDNVLARPPAVADLKMVKLGPPRYQPGPIAHIENVMRSERRKRTHRLREENEQTTTRETERTEETERDLTTASNVQMQQMAMETLTSSVDVEAGAKVSASYGPTVSVELNGNLARHDSRESVNQASQSLSNSVTQVARDKIVQRMREERVTRQLIVTEELNLHSFENTSDGADHIQGVYRYVNQVQDAWMENYGKRLMLEFIVPEPARVLRWAMGAAEQEGANDPEPPKPTAPDDPNTNLSPEHITDLNYLQLAGTYGAVGVTPPSSPSVDLALSHTTPAQQGETLFLFADHTTLTVPDGFEAASWSAQCVTWGAGGPDHSWMVGVGQDAAPTEGPGEDALAKHVNGNFDRKQQSKIPVIMLGRGLLGFSASVNVHCNRTGDKLNEWKLKVFDQVMAAWRASHEEWESRQARADAIARSDALSAPITGSDNPDQNRAVERRELRRNVIAMLLGTPQDEGPFAGDAIAEEANGRPVVDLDVASRERDGIQFFEQAFEWSNMTYIHYPYYWAQGDEWVESITRTAADPLWAAFLSAGASRVSVPVRPGFENTVSLYLGTGVYWPGGQVPTVGDPAYLGLAEEVAESLGAGLIDPERTDLDPVVLPTPLIWLQPDGDLNPELEPAPA
jgi:hypothetical protein